jgi:parallel beta-helix repeat protein
MIYRCQGWGIHLWHAANQVEIANNTVFNNAYGGILIGDGDDPGGFPPGVVDDNTIVSNNIVYRNGRRPEASGYGIEEYGNTGPHNQYVNNLVFENGPADWKLQNGIIPVASIAADPQFVNYRDDGSGDYHLQSGSPALHSGTANAAKSESDVGIGATLASNGRIPILR